MVGYYPFSLTYVGKFDSAIRTYSHILCTCGAQYCVEYGLCGHVYVLHIVCGFINYCDIHAAIFMCCHLPFVYSIIGTIHAIHTPNRMTV